MNKLAVIYNCAGISGNENPHYYAHVVESIYNQNLDVIPVISGCSLKEEVIQFLKSKFPDIFLVNTRHIVPISVSFNLAVQKTIEKFGPSEGYLYLDYGITFGDNKNAVGYMYDLFKSGPYSMVSSRVDSDSGYHLWFGLGKFHGDESCNSELFLNGDFIVPIGKCVNLHAQIFSHELYEAYSSRIFPDIFSAYCLESVFSFMNGAIGRKWIIGKDLILHHEQLAYNACSAFGRGFNGLDAKFLDPKPIMEVMQPSYEFGGGYDESRGLLLHNSEKYDENGYCLDPRLKTFINDNYFLTKQFLDYSKISYKIY